MVDRVRCSHCELGPAAIWPCHDFSSHSSVWWHVDHFQYSTLLWRTIHRHILCGSQMHVIDIKIDFPGKEYRFVFLFTNAINCSRNITKCDFKAHFIMSVKLASVLRPSHLSLPGDGIPGVFQWEWLLRCPWRSLNRWFVWMVRVQKALSHCDLHNDRSTSSSNSIFVTSGQEAFLMCWLVFSFVLWQRLFVMFSCAALQNEADFLGRVKLMIPH